MTRLSLDRESFVAAAAGERPAVVRVTAPLAVDATPLAAYATLSGRRDDDPDDYAFLLESAEKVASSDPDGAFRPSREGADRHARYSFVGYDPEAAVTLGPEGPAVTALRSERVAETVREAVAAAEGDTMDRLRAALPDVRLANRDGGDRQHLDGGLVGFLAYDAVYDLYLEEVGYERPDSRFPDAQFVLTTRTVVFDELRDETALTFTPLVFPGDDAGAVYDALAAEADRVADRLDGAETPDGDDFEQVAAEAAPREDYEDAVARAKEHILDGDIYQGVVSRTRQRYGDVDAMALYRALREINPSPYMYLLGFDDLDIVGASPETLVSVREDEVMLNPIAGTCQRGPSPVEDRRLAGELLADGKERAEHTMLVDLARNDARRVSTSGSVRVEEFMNVLKYSHVQHIESTVTGEIAPEDDAFDAIRAAMPAGTLSGAPKIRAMEIIHDLEAAPRGPYGGGVGYVSWGGDADTAIVIRTATVEHGVTDGRVEGRTDRITVQAGAGIVADSDPAAEYEETEDKMGGVLDALEDIRREPREVSR